MTTFNTRIDLFIGLVTSQATGYQQLNKDLTLRRIAELLIEYGIDGFTAVDCYGFWNGLAEPSLNVFWFTDFVGNVDDIAQELAVILNQESILVNVTPANARLVDAPAVS